MSLKFPAILYSPSEGKQTSFVHSKTLKTSLDSNCSNYLHCSLVPYSWIPAKWFPVTSNQFILVTITKKTLNVDDDDDEEIFQKN